ncbi:MAG: polysaccharide deacetylase family protein [Gammaproteobacteria bacterium]|nr:polysaccharide deacetylase family protein [Gammaproteobacteria bacterium]
MHPTRTSFAFLAVLILFTPLAGAADHCVVLQYHHISEDTPGITSVTPEQFQEHLDYLLINDHVVMPLEDVITALKTGEDLPERCVALTIDDAYISAYDEAYPRVVRYAYPLTVFVSTDAVDQDLNGFLSWEQMREMGEHGITFQNHSRTHDHLIRRLDVETGDDWEQRVAADIQYAQNRIAQELGVDPTLFAYPYGEYNLDLKRMVGSMGLIGFGQQSGPLWRQADFDALPRFPMASIYASMRTFPNKVLSLPLPIAGAFPDEPVVPLDEWQPPLTLVFKPDAGDLQELTCYLNGSPEVTYVWQEQPAGAVTVTPKGRLNVGRNRMNCTLPISESGRFGWYSHNWIRRESDGGWYRESK